MKQKKACGFTAEPMSPVNPGTQLPID